MRYSELIQLYFERSNALQWYWTLYVVVVGGLLAFSSLRVRQDIITVSLVSVLFCCFAYKNLDAIHDTAAQRSAALQAISALAPQLSASDDRQVAQTLAPTLVSPDYDGVRNFHVASDVLTIAAIWAMELRRIRAAGKT
jgi:hypothetical protein